MLISISDIISRAWKIYTEHWRYLITYMGLYFVPSALMFILGVFSIYFNDIFPATTTPTSILLLILLILSALVSLWAYIALVRALNILSNENRELPWKEAFAASGHLIWPFIYTSCLVVLIYVSGTLLFIIPGIIFAGWFALTPMAVVLDEERGLLPLKTSKRLVSGRWWGIFFRVLAPNLLRVAVDQAHELSTHTILLASMRGSSAPVPRFRLSCRLWSR